MTKTKGLTYKELMDLALENYNNGGDDIYECWDEQTFEEYITNFGPITRTKAKKMFKDFKAVDDEYMAAARYFSGMDW